MNVNKLKGLMAEHGVTRQELAEVLKMSPYTLRERLEGHYHFKVNELVTISEFFNVPISIFFDDVVPNLTNNIE